MSNLVLASDTPQSLAVKDAAEKTKKIVAVAAQERKAAPVLYVEPLTDEANDTGSITVFGVAPNAFDDLMRAPDTVVGATPSDNTLSVFESPALTPEMTSEYPTLQRIYKQFQAVEPTQKPVRVDTQATYDKYRADRLAPVLAELDARLTELEQALAEHESDGHGGVFNDPAGLDSLSADVSRLQAISSGASTKIPLSLPPFLQGKVDCWQDGNNIFCSMKMPGPDSTLRIATTCTPYAPHVQEVLGYTQKAGVDPAEVLGVLPTLAQMLGGGSLIPQLASAAPDLMTQPEVKNKNKPFFGRLTTKSNPSLAATMALMQLVQQGDRNATAEYDRLVAKAKANSTGELAQILTDGQNRLLRAQAVKAAGQTSLVGAAVPVSGIRAMRVIPRFIVQDTITSPVKVVTMPYGPGVKTITNVSKAVVTGGDLSIPAYDKTCYMYNTPKSVQVYVPGAKVQTFLNLQSVAVYGGQRQSMGR